MIDKEMIKDIETLITEEIERTNKKHAPTFNTYHEGYAILKEEIEEAEDEMKHINCELTNAWNSIKDNRNESVLFHIRRLKINAIYLAAEAIQVSAMASKFLESFE